jgi:hypothetical protein
MLMYELASVRIMDVTTLGKQVYDKVLIRG